MTCVARGRPSFGLRVYACLPVSIYLSLCGRLWRLYNATATHHFPSTSHDALHHRFFKSPPTQVFFSHHHRSHYRTYTTVSRTVKKMASARGPVYRYIACTRVNVEHGTVQLIASYYIPSTPKRIMQAVDSVSACECHYLNKKLS